MSDEKVSRRTFIRATGLAGAATVVAPAFLRQDARAQETPSPVFRDPAAKRGGTLRYGIDEERTLGANWRPDVVRRLDRLQVQEVWALARQLGLTDPAKGDEPINFALVKAEPNQVVYLAAFTGNDDSWEFVRRSTFPAGPDPSMTTLARRLAQLAWASDVQDSIAAMMPIRYNFGPDPYARYRSPATAPSPQ